MTNPEGLTEQEILDKIKHLSKSIHKCILYSGELFCKNRIARVQLLKTYL